MRFSVVVRLAGLDLTRANVVRRRVVDCHPDRSGGKRNARLSAPGPDAKVGLLPTRTDLANKFKFHKAMSAHSRA